MLTNSKARAASPRAGRYELTCEALPGFLLRVLPSGKKVFFARFRDADGKDNRHRLGVLGPGYSADDARREAMVILARREADAGSAAGAATPRPARAAAKQPEPVRPPAAATPTLREFAVRFEQEHIDIRLKPGSASHYRSALRLYILPALGDHRLDAITTADVQRLHNSLRPTPSAANMTRCVLSAVFTKAELWGVTSRRNPVRVVGRFQERAVERYLSPEERHALEHVLTAAEHTPPGVKGHIGRENVWAIRLLALSGMRRDEIRDLRWEQVDWRQSILHLPDSKTGKRDVVVSDEVMHLLASIAATKGSPRRGLVVCSSTGNKLHSLGRSWSFVRGLAGLPDMRLHDLRHSVASDAIMNGVPLQVVGKMLGHRSYRTTERYAHIADTVLRDAVNLTSGMIVRAGGGEPHRTRSTTKAVTTADRTPT